MSTLMLRTVLLACAISGALVFACGEDTSGDTGNARGDDEDDDDGDDDDDTTKKDGGSKKDASSNRDASKDSASSAECTGTTPMLCIGDNNEMGIQLCMNGKLGPCTTAGSIAGDAATVETCPDGFMCQTIPMLGSFCSNGGRVTCETADDCTAAGLEGASCTMIPVLGSICQLRCTGNTTPPPAGGNDSGTSTTVDSGSPRDSGSTTSDSGSSSSADASRDSGGSANRDR